MNKILTFAIVLTIAVNSAMAQNQIKGLLADNQTKSPVSFASIALFSLPDSAQLTGMISSNDGTFNFEGLKQGAYFYKIKFLGYHDVQSSGIRLDGKPGTLDLGTIGLDVETKNIKEVNIIGERLKGVETVDNTTYTIPESAVKVAGNGTDILKRIPAVQVDLSNNISLQGSSNIILLVDGKERDQNFIAQLDPKIIDKVEVSTNPSSKYDASVTGVINIILKKQKRIGINGNADLEIPTSTDHYITSPSAGIDYGYNKLHLFTSFNGHFEGFKVYKDFKRISNHDQFTANGEGRFHYHSPYIHYGFDYFINDRNTFNFYANYNYSDNMMNYMYQKYNLTDGQISQYYTSGNNSRTERNGQFYSVFYKKSFEKQGHEITTDISYYINHGTTKNTYTDQYYLNDMSTPDGGPVYRSELLFPDRKSLNVKIDYKLPLGSKYIFEAGYQSYIQWIENTMNYSDVLQPVFRYTEKRNAGYAQIGAKFGKWNLRAGSRAEQSGIDIDKTKTTSYFCILPNATAQFTIDKTQNLKLAYRRSITRPGSDELNPFAITFDSMNIVKGNPNLKPSYSDKIQLNYGKNIGSSYLGPEIYFVKNTDVFQNYITVNDNNAMEINIDNIGQGYEYGLGFSGSIQATKWFMINPYGKIYRQHVESTGAKTVLLPQKDHNAWQVSMYALVKLPKGFNLWSYVTYNSPSISFQSTNYRSPLYVLGLEKSIMKDKGKIGINWYELFKDRFRFQRQVTDNGLVYQDDDNHVRLSTLVSMKFTYHFSYGREVKKLERQKSLESDGSGGLN